MGVWQHLMEYSEQSRSFLLHKWSCRDHRWSFFFPALRLRVSGVCFLVIKAPNITDWFFQWEFALWSFLLSLLFFSKSDGTQSERMRRYAAHTNKHWWRFIVGNYYFPEIQLPNLRCGVKKNTYDIKITVFNNNWKLKNEDVVKRKII